MAFNLSKHSLFLGELAFIDFVDDSFFHLCRVLCVILTTAVFLNSMVVFCCCCCSVPQNFSVYLQTFSWLPLQVYIGDSQVWTLNLICHSFMDASKETWGSPLSPFSRGRKGNHFSYTPIEAITNFIHVTFLISPQLLVFSLNVLLSVSFRHDYIPPALLELHSSLLSCPQSCQPHSVYCFHLDLF